MAFVASGLMYEQIAAEMKVSEIWVRIHRDPVMKKMESRSLADFDLNAEALGVQSPQGTTTPPPV